MVEQELDRLESEHVADEHDHRPGEQEADAAAFRARQAHECHEQGGQGEVSGLQSQHGVVEGADGERQRERHDLASRVGDVVGDGFVVRRRAPRHEVEEGDEDGRREGESEHHARRGPSREGEAVSARLSEPHERPAADEQGLEESRLGEPGEQHPRDRKSEDGDAGPRAPAPASRRVRVGRALQGRPDHLDAQQPQRQEGDRVERRVRHDGERAVDREQASADRRGDPAEPEAAQEGEGREAGEDLEDDMHDEDAVRQQLQHDEGLEQRSRLHLTRKRLP